MTATGQAIVRDGEIFTPARVDMKQFLTRLSSDEGVQEQQQLSAAYDRACHALIGPNDIQTEGDREFKKKSAWRKLQRYFTISTAVVNAVDKLAPGDNGESIFIAIVTVRAMAPWGQYSEAIGACATDEESGQRVITIADALATAETRATNRAVSNLIAMGEVSAEELQKGKASNGGNGNSDMKRQEKDPGEFRIPFGPSKGTKLSAMTLDDLEGAIDWAAGKGKFDDFQKAGRAEIARRKNPPKKEEPAAAAAPAKKEPPAQIDPLVAPGAASTSHPVPAPGKVADALDSPVDRAFLTRIARALESPAIGPETRALFAEDRQHKFTGAGRHSLEWWTKKLEELAAKDDGGESDHKNKQLDDLF